MKIAIISDLHVGTGSQAKDFSVGDTDNAVITNYMDSFRKKFNTEEHCCDVLLIAGDITNKARADEFDLASRRIKDIANTLNIKEDNIFFTPGNHDSNWVVGESLESQGEIDIQKIREHRYNFLNSNDFFKKRVAYANSGNFHNSPYSVLWSTDKLVVLSYNSSANDKHNEKPHKGQIDSEITSLLTQQLKQHKDDIQGKVKVLLLHHHPINYEDKTYKETDYSIMANATALIDFAGESCFDFIIHGHKHVARYKHLITEAHYPMNILCSGSFSASLSNKYFNGVGNSFHIIEIDKLCEETEIPQGRILSWSHFAQHGWIENKADREELTHEECFGANLNRVTLQKILRTMITDKFKLSDCIQWDEILQLNNQLSYCSSTVVSIVLNELSQEIGFQIYNPPNVILLKNQGEENEK